MKIKRFKIDSVCITGSGKYSIHFDDGVHCYAATVTPDGTVTDLVILYNRKRLGVAEHIVRHVKRDDLRALVSDHVKGLDYSVA